MVTHRAGRLASFMRRSRLVGFRREGANNNVDCCDEPFPLEVVFFAGGLLAVDWVGEAPVSMESIQHEQ